MDLNPAQKRLVEAEPSGHSLIRGVAGSGKTTVALHRALFLRRNYCFEPGDKILLVTFNRTLINYMRHLLNKLEDKDYYRNIFSSDERTVDVRTVDSLAYQYQPVKSDVRLPGNNERYSLIEECIVELRKHLDSPILDRKNIPFLLNEIKWIKACNYMELEEYQHVDRIGRQSFESGEGPQRLAKGSPARKAIYELMLLYTKKINERGHFDFLDCALAALNHASIEEKDKYTHIIIDEAQDLTRVQLELLKLLYAHKKHSSFTVIMDTAQSIYPHAWLVKGRSFTSIGFDMSGKSHILSKSNRNTRQIAQTAYGLIQDDENITGDEHYVIPSVIDKQGTEPVFRRHESEKEEARYVCARIKELTAGRYSFNDIAVIARLHQQLDYIQEHLTEAGIPCYRPRKRGEAIDERAVHLLTMHAIKGLEFKVVLIIGLNERVMPLIPGEAIHEDSKLIESNERKLLYVGMTRATEMLFLSSSGTPSPFIAGIEAMLRLSHRAKIKSFYRVNPEDYLFRDRLHSLWSSEEKVRQWMLKELLHTYGYPLLLIDLEYKVSSFSGTGGSVDIVIYKHGSRAPDIFIETKAPGSDLAKGCRPLESYMSHCRSCRYGVLTDGTEMQVIDQDFSEVDDIPAYIPSPQMPQVEEYYYTEVRAPRGHRFIFDGFFPGTIIEKMDEAEREFGAADLVEIPVFHRIAAGAPGFMNDQSEDRFCLPREWVKGKGDGRLFMLKVEGDSMIGVDINHGDYVLARKQETAENTDIVVAALGEEATLKEFMKIGGRVFLIPKNSKYSRIEVESERARVLGKVIGIVKPRRADAG